jgi:hypothetical protein
LPDYVIEPLFSRASIQDYVHLFGTLFAGSSKLTAPYLEWLYTQNPDGLAIGADAFVGDGVGPHTMSPSPGAIASAMRCSMLSFR